MSPLKNNYRLVNDEEPTDTQLKKLIHAVAVEAKRKAKETNRKLLDAITQATLAEMQKKQAENIK